MVIDGTKATTKQICGLLHVLTIATFTARLFFLGIVPIQKGACLTVSEQKTKLGAGVYATLLSAVLSAAAGIYFQVIGGIFGATRRNCYDVWVVILLALAFVLPIAFIAIRKYGLASAAATACSGVSILFFVHKCYWYVSDVFVAIDEKGFDNKFLVFAGLAFAAFLVGEVSVYLRKVKKTK